MNTPEGMFRVFKHETQCFVPYWNTKNKTKELGAADYSFRQTLKYLFKKGLMTIKFEAACQIIDNIWQNSK